MLAALPLTDAACRMVRVFIVLPLDFVFDVLGELCMLLLCVELKLATPAVVTDLAVEFTVLLSMPPSRSGSVELLDGTLFFPL